MLLANCLSINEVNYLRQIKNKDQISIRITNHFFERWNERVKSPKFKYKQDLINYLEALYCNKKIHQIKDKHYIINDDIIAVIKTKQNKRLALFITTYGSTVNNPILYNMCIDGDIHKNFRKYGKLNLDYIY